MRLLFGVITAIRNLRQELNVPAAAEVAALFSASEQKDRQLLEEMTPVAKRLARLTEVRIEERYRHSPSSAHAVIGGIHVTVPLAGVVDLESEKAKIEERIRKASCEITAKEKMLENKDFVGRAPAEIVEKERERLRQLLEALGKLKAVKDGLG